METRQTINKYDSEDKEKRNLNELVKNEAPNKRSSNRKELKRNSMDTDDKCTGCRYRPRPTNLQKESSSSDNDFEHSFVSDLKAWGVTIGKTIGEGSYSKVKKVFINSLNASAAMKIVSREKVKKDFLKKFFPREVHILKKLNHPNITKLLDIIYCRDRICLVMELARRGDLLRYIQKRVYIKEQQAKIIFRQILLAVQYLHTNGIFHRDLKCENVLLDDNLVVKISDFGFAREWSDANRLCKTFCGSSAYASPEVIRGIPYDPHDSDIWSIGVVLFIMTTGSMAYDDRDLNKMLKLMDAEEIPFLKEHPNFLSSDAVNLIKQILRKEPKERATINQMLNHAWTQCSEEPTDKS
ncbi:testis-specific serine/threonine-protein kinase 1-like [Anneissia japonica]|uniref:testis-specific serine/threonine-protein kinase 1-like n=1 Tax=Anneissia japonica TaxID=1529436 RepID=UPI0014256356|nr:testis-specific serine/threonine-protein kinase 1-like [Anneissia japonica]